MIAGRVAHLLIVDDERHNRTLLEVMLEPEGFVLSTATNGEEALAKVAKDPPDLVILDVLMPGMGGYQVARALKNNLATKHIPIIMVTALDDRDARMLGLSAGAEDFLTRPLDRAELCVRVRNLLRLKTASDGALAERDNSMSMVSHDLRNLLHGIVLQTTMLVEDAADMADGQDMTIGLKRVLSYAGRMGRLVDDLVDVVSIDAGKLGVEPARHAAALLVAEIVDSTKHAAAAQGITIRCDPVDPSLMGTFDRERLLQVLGNLISNAIKFTPRGGSIVVRCDETETGLQLSVRDTGVGIPSQLLGAVFERFVQVAHDHRGLGLGLHISKCIVESHGGRMWVESKLGEGSTFYVTIPSVIPKQTARAPEASLS